MLSGGAEFDEEAYEETISKLANVATVVANVSN